MDDLYDDDPEFDDDLDDLEDDDLDDLDDLDLDEDDDLDLEDDDESFDIDTSFDDTDDDF